jgi:hypothetical protein
MGFGQAEGLMVAGLVNFLLAHNHSSLADHRLQLLGPFGAQLLIGTQRYDNGVFACGHNGNTNKRILMKVLDFWTK